jgi:hypothetical protein
VSAELVRTVLLLSFFGLCGLVAEILVENRRHEAPRRQPVR